MTRAMPVNFIAEVSSNHNRSIERSIKFIDEAARIGCTAVKFQLFKINELFAPEILERSPTHRERVNWELPLEFLPILSDCSKKKGLEFGCTPFYLKAVEQLFPYVDFYKIASYELLWSELLKFCALTNKPVILSTGMATLEEIKTAVGILTENGCSNLTLLHCVSGYPTPIIDANLAAITTLRNQFGCSVGWSDHSVKSGIIYRAIHHWNASTIEFHLDIDGSGEEFKTGHCWLPDQMQSVIQNISDAFEADGNGEKIPRPSELQDRSWRADPTDGLRPFREVRRKFIDENSKR